MFVCIIPAPRKRRSRTIASLVTGPKLAAQGVRELNLVAQDRTEYGMEGRYRENLEMLLPGFVKWMNRMDSPALHIPRSFSDNLIEIIARSQDRQIPRHDSAQSGPHLD